MFESSLLLVDFADSQAPAPPPPPPLPTTSNCWTLMPAKKGPGCAGGGSRVTPPPFSEAIPPVSAVRCGAGIYVWSRDFLKGFAVTSSPESCRTIILPEAVDCLWVEYGVGLRANYRRVFAGRGIHGFLTLVPRRVWYIAQASVANISSALKPQALILMLPGALQYLGKQFHDKVDLSLLCSANRMAGMFLSSSVVTAAGYSCGRQQQLTTNRCDGISNERSRSDHLLAQGPSPPLLAGRHHPGHQHRRRPRSPPTTRRAALV